MNADDVVFSFKHIMDPKVASYTSWMLVGVKKCEKIDNYTVKYTLSSPDSSWIDVMAISAGAVFSKKFYEALSDPTKFGTSSVGVMGTSPYVFKSWTEGQQVTMTKNPNYWDKDHQPTFDEADIVVMPDAVTRINAIGVNQIQSAFFNPCTQIDLMNSFKNSGVVVEFRNAYTSQTMYFNTTRRAFTDANCRKAVASCFDSPTYVTGILKGAGGVSSASMTLPSMQRGDKSV